MPRPALRAATVALAVAALVPTATVAPAASAQTLPERLLPGADGSQPVVVTDSPYVSVGVTGHASGGASVTVSVTNNYDHAFSCWVPGASADSTPAKLDNAVATAEIVQKSVDYYRTNTAPAAGGTNVPMLGLLQTGSLLNFLPTSSLLSAFAPSLGGEVELNSLWNKAQVAGETGDIAPFTLPARGSYTTAVTLGMPTTAQRVDFQAAALLYCTDTTTGQAYVFAGYEGGKAPARAAASGTGSLSGASVKKSGD